MKIQTCRICLVMDVKMFPLGDTQEKTFIENLFKQSGFNQKLIAEHYACYECRALLGNTIKFIQKALKAQHVLCDILKKNNKITPILLRDLDRHTLGLDMNLKKQTCFNIHLYQEDCSEDWSNTSSNSKDADSDFIQERECYLKMNSDACPEPLESASANTISQTEKNVKVIRLKSENASVLNEKKHESLNQGTNVRNIVYKSEIDENGTDLSVFQKQEESECFIEIATKEFLDPLASAPVADNLICFEPDSNIKNDEPQSNTFDVEIKIEDMNVDLTKDAPEETNALILDSVKDKIKAYKLKSKLLLDSLLINKLKGKRRIFTKTSRLKTNNKVKERKEYQRKRQNSKLKPSLDKGPKLVEIDLDRTVRRIKKGEGFSDNSSDKTKKKSKKKKDDDFFPTSSCESQDSTYESYDNDSQRVLRPEQRNYPITCEQCNFTISCGRDHYIHYLQYHKNVQYPYSVKSVYVCQFCGKTMKRPAHHRDHELTHGDKLIQCTVCPKKFYNMKQMKSHVRSTHFPKKIYECDYCGKTSKVRADFMLHLRIHTGEKPYLCHICGAGFAHNGNRAIHIRVNHQQSTQYKTDKKRKRIYNYTSEEDTELDEEIEKKRKAYKPKSKQVKKHKQNSL